MNFFNENNEFFSEMSNCNDFIYYFDCDNENRFNFGFENENGYGNEYGNEYEYENKYEKKIFSENSNFNLNVENLTSDNTMKKTNELDGNIPKNYISIDEIEKNIFDKETYKDIFTFDIKNKLIKDIQTEESFLNKKRFKDITDNNESNNNFSIEKEKPNKRGRKPKNEQGERKHSKNSGDNIILKIKTKLFNYLIKNLNKTLKKKLGKIDTKRIIYDLDQKYIKQLKRSINLQLLDKPLKNLLSLDISTKYNNQKIPINTNKINIQKILNNEPDDTIKFIFNMTFRDWIECFICKKNLYELLSINNIENNFLIDFESIKEITDGLNEFLKEIAEENDDNYFSLFIYYLYNYECWFFNKKGKIKTKVNHEISIEI